MLIRDRLNRLLSDCWHCIFIDFAEMIKLMRKVLCNQSIPYFQFSLQSQNTYSIFLSCKFRSKLPAFREPALSKTRTSLWLESDIGSSCTTCFSFFFFLCVLSLPFFGPIRRQFVHSSICTFFDCLVDSFVPSAVR